MKKIAPSKTITGRNYGIDTLRILSMLMVLILHILCFGGVLDSVGSNPLRCLLTWSLEVAAFCAVNCYGLISGYVGINSKYKLSNIIVLWLQVCIYTVLCSYIFFFLKIGDVEPQQLWMSFFPLFKGDLWYFRAYVGLFLFMPLINRSILAINRKQATFLCLTIIVFFSTIELFSKTDPFTVGEGYNTFWLILLYILGACFRRFNFFENVKPIFFLLVYIICVGISVVGSYLSINEIVRYTSPTILLCGITLLLFFSRIQVQSRFCIKLLTALSPLAFGVYVIHMQDPVFDLIFRYSIFSPIGRFPAVLTVCAVLLCAIILFFFFIAIDAIRLFLFKKLRIKEGLLKLENKIFGNLWQ